MLDRVSEMLLSGKDLPSVKRLSQWQGGKTANKDGILQVSSYVNTCIFKGMVIKSNCLKI